MQFYNDLTAIVCQIESALDIHLTDFRHLLN